MSLLLYDNLVTDALITASVDTGTLTNNTSPDKLATRNLADAYNFTCSASATMTITINSINSTIRALGLLSSGVLPNLSIELDGSPDTPDHEDQKNKLINSVVTKDTIFSYDAAQGAYSAISFVFSP